MTDRRVILIRAVLLVIVAICVLPFSFWASYSSALILFGLCMPPLFPSCEGACEPGTAPSTASVTFAGYASHACATGNCTSSNGTFVVPVGNGSAVLTGGCNWDYPNFPCAQDGINKALAVAITSDATNTKVDVAIGCFGGSTNWNNYSWPASPMDCGALISAGTIPLSLANYSCSAAFGCDPTPVTASVVFA